MKKIFEEVALPRLRLKNRLVRSATWEDLAGPDGCTTGEILDIYSELAQGGVGAIITGFTSVTDLDRYFSGMMRLSNDRLIPQYRQLVEVIHAKNCAVLAQLAQGAYYRSEEDGRVSQVEPDDMSQADIQHTIAHFAAAAHRADLAGFDGVQIHAAHFFFLSRFISPAVNHRRDEYGCSNENGGRILLEILHAIRTAAPRLHISVKINSQDFIPQGLDEYGSMAICLQLAAAGIDSIEVSGNGTSVAGIRPHRSEAYFADFAARLADVIGVPVILVGGLRSLDVMERLLNSTNIELFSLSRPLLCEPDLPERLRIGAATESRCISCNRCYSSYGHKCVFRRPPCSR